jgi:predicted dehydrogenase
MTVGLGVVGCGWAAGEIARVAADLPQMKIVAATDADPGRAAAYAERSGAAVAVDIEALLVDPAITAIYAGLPHHLLAPIVRRALAAGKHVLAEKPLALTAEEAVALGELADTAGLKLTVFFELRRSGSVQLARRLVSEGAIGVPHFIRIRTIIDKKLGYWGTKEQPNWRALKREAGGGVLLMNTIHQLDTLRYVTGLDYIRASGEIDTFTASAEVEDAFSATLRLSNGGLVSIAGAAHSPGADDEETIEIDGNAGRLDLPDPFGTGPIRLYQPANGWRDIPIDRPDSHALMLKDFLDAIIDGRSVPAGAADAAAVLAAVNAIYRSAAEGRSVDIQVGASAANASR